MHSGWFARKADRIQGPDPVVDLPGFACGLIVFLNMNPDDAKRLGQWREGRPSFYLADLLPGHDIKTAHEHD